MLRPLRENLWVIDLPLKMPGGVQIGTRTTGAYGHFGPSRLARSFMKDKAAVRAGVERILDLDFDRVIVTHGDVVETGGREALREAFSKVG